MTATGHALIATLIVAKIQNPYVSLPLAFVSHFACDLIPHWDPGTHRHEITKKRLFNEAAVDVIISIISSFFLYHYLLGQNNYAILFIGIFLAQLPDWITAPYLMLSYSSPLSKWSKYMYKIQHELNARLENPILGILTQVVIVMFLYLFLFIVL